MVLWHFDAMQVRTAAPKTAFPRLPPATAILGYLEPVPNASTVMMWLMLNISPVSHSHSPFTHTPSSRLVSSRPISNRLSRTTPATDIPPHLPWTWRIRNFDPHFSPTRVVQPLDLHLDTRPTCRRLSFIYDRYLRKSCLCVAFFAAPYY